MKIQDLQPLTFILTSVICISLNTKDEGSSPVTTVHPVHITFLLYIHCLLSTWFLWTSEVSISLPSLPISTGSFEVLHCPPWSKELYTHLPHFGWDKLNGKTEEMKMWLQFAFGTANIFSDLWSAGHDSVFLGYTPTPTFSSH